jgi:hypothetical protein
MVLKLVRDFRDKHGEVSLGGFTPTERGNALYYHKAGVALWARVQLVSATHRLVKRGKLRQHQCLSNQQA